MPHPLNSQSGQSHRRWKLHRLQVRVSSSVHRESEILLFIQWKLNKTTLCTEKQGKEKRGGKKGQERYQIVGCISLEIGGGSDFSSILREISKFPGVSMLDS